MEVRDRVIGIISDQLGIKKEKIREGTSLVNHFGADSLDIVEIVMELEKEFDINITDADADRLGANSSPEAVDAGMAKDGDRYTTVGLCIEIVQTLNDSRMG